MCIIGSFKAEFMISRPFAVAAEAATNGTDQSEAERLWSENMESEEATVKVEFAITDKVLADGQALGNPELHQKVQEKVNQLVAEITELCGRAGIVTDPEAFGFRMETLGTKPGVSESLELGIFAEEKETNEETNKEEKKEAA